MGRSGQRGSRQGRQLWVVGSMCAVVLVGGVAAAVAGPGDDGRADGATLRQVTTTTTGPRPTTTVASTTTSTVATSTTSTTSSTAPPPPPVTPGATTVRDGDVEVTVRADRVDVGAGERLWLDMVVRNVGRETFAWQSGGCSVLASAWLAPDGGDRPVSDREVGWDGDPATLRSWVEAENLVPVERPAGPPGWRMVACPANFGLTAVPPGTSVEQRTSIEVRLRPGAVPAGGRYLLLMSFQPWPPDVADADPSNPPAPVVASLPVQVHDHPARGDGDAGPALDAIAGHEAIARWVEDTQPRDGAAAYRTELSWWRGAWELWLSTNQDGHLRELRVRYDPAVGRVVDVREVHQGVPAEDEPDATRPDNPNIPPDDVYASGEGAAP